MSCSNEEIKAKSANGCGIICMLETTDYSCKDLDDRWTNITIGDTNLCCFYHPVPFYDGPIPDAVVDQTCSIINNNLLFLQGLDEPQHIKVLFADNGTDITKQYKKLIELNGGISNGNKICDEIKQNFFTNWIPTPKPSTNYYKCNTAGQCIQDDTQKGYEGDPTCSNECKTPSTNYYKCNTAGQCIQDDTQQGYKGDPKCSNECKTPTPSNSNQKIIIIASISVIIFLFLLFLLYKFLI